MVIEKIDRELFSLIYTEYCKIKDYSGSGYRGLPTIHEQILFNVLRQNIDNTFPEIKNFKLSFIEIYDGRFSFNTAFSQKKIIISCGAKKEKNSKDFT